MINIHLFLSDENEIFFFENRRTVAEPAIEYFDNGRYINPISSISMEPKRKIRRIQYIDNWAIIYYEDDLDTAKDTANQCSSISNVDEMGVVENETSLRKVQRFRSSKLPPGIEEKKVTKELLIESEDLSNCNKNNSSSEPVNSEQSPKQHNVNKSDSRSPVTCSQSNNSDNRDMTSPPAKKLKSLIPLKGKSDESKVLSEDKMKQYIDEYDSFIQQVSSPLNDPLSSADADKSISHSQLIDVSHLILHPNLLNDKDSSKIRSLSTPSPAKNHDKLDRQSTSSSGSDNDSSSSTSSSSSSSSDDDSSSTCSSSTSSSDNENSDDESHRGKSNSRSGSSRSASRSPRIRLSKPTKSNAQMYSQLIKIDK